MSQNIQGPAHTLGRRFHESWNGNKSAGGVMDKPRKKGNTDAVQYQKCPNHVYLYIELNK